MEHSYYAVFQYTPEWEVNRGTFALGIYFPDLTGCVSCADDIEHGLEMAKEILALWLEMLLDKNKCLPNPSHEEDLKKSLTPCERLFKITVRLENHRGGGGDVTKW